MSRSIRLFPLISRVWPYVSRWVWVWSTNYDPVSPVLTNQDDVVITREGQLNLSVNAPKEVVDVEAACQGLLEG